MQVHIPVLLDKILEHFDPRPGQRFIDATVDGGGHAPAILEKINPGGKLLGIEWDGELLKHLKFKVENFEIKSGLVLVNDSYVNLKEIAEQNDFMGADGILFDLGLSSWHLESAGRGFSFQKDEPLDMRFAGAYADSQLPVSSGGLTAGEIVKDYSYDELVKILKEYGEERFAKSISAGITKARKEKPIKSTFDLIEVIKSPVPFWYRRGRLHFATKTFQALRIAVNNELGNIEIGLERALEVLRAGGCLSVITFHSLEDRIVKIFFRSRAAMGNVEIATKKPVMPSLDEITANPRARSAKLRVAVKI